MQWLTPLIGIYASAAAVPALLLLYFLKLKRREQVVSSTLLWKRAVQDLQVNAPFQRLRRNILLLLQLLMLLAILVALAGPILSLVPGAAKRYVLLIDRSASMNATDVEPSRLYAAKEKALDFVDSMRNRAAFSLRDSADQAMIIAFDDHADVMCNFTSDKQQLIQAVEAIEAGDGKSLLNEAVTVARAFAQSPGVEGNIRTAEEPALLRLFSDGRIQDLDEIVVGEEELTYHAIGDEPSNLAITAMQARRSYEDPEQVSIFVSLANYGDDPVTTDVQLSIDANVRAVRSVKIPPDSTDPDGERSPGTSVVNFAAEHSEAGIVEVSHLHADNLTVDNAAWAILEAPRRLSVLLVSEGNAALEMALRACSLEKLDPCTPAGFDSMDHARFEVTQPYDIVVLDNHSPENLPRGRYLIFGRPPAGLGVPVTGKTENEVVVDWRSQHPVLRHVNLDNLFVGTAHKMELPRDAEVLAEFSTSPAIAVLRRDASVFVLAGFDSLQSNWPFEPGFVLFCYNAVSFLGAQSAGEQNTNLAVSDPIRIEGVVPGTKATIDGPDMPATEIQASPSGAFRFAQTHRAGVYRVGWGQDSEKFFAVNLLDLAESDIFVAEEIVPGGRVVAAEKALTRANLELWPYLVLAALIIAFLEWLVYNYKVRI